MKKTEKNIKPIRVYNPSYAGKRNRSDMSYGLVVTLGWQRLTDLLLAHGNSVIEINKSDDIIGFVVTKDKGINVWLDSGGCLRKHK